MQNILEKIKSINIKCLISKIKKGLAKIKINPIELSVIAIVLLLSCIVIVPSLVQCIVNRNKTNCSNHINEMLSILSHELEYEEENGGTYWHDMIKNGNYQKLVTSLSDKTHNSKFLPSDYYIQTGDETLTLLCKRHKDLSGHSIRFSTMRSVNVEIAEKPQIGGQIAYMTVTGPDTYYQGEVLDSSNPQKMVFRGLEADKAIQNLTVTAVYMGGARKELARSQYTITTDELDMTKPGQTHLIIKYNSTSLWDDSAYVPFVIDIIGSDDVSPLIVDGGIAGRFELASWEWRDFVDEASAEPEGKDFGASIVYYNGQYYYYPEGMRIVNSNKNNSPLEFALDVADTSKPAYNIVFDRNSVVTNDNDEKSVHVGSLKIENDLVYIWHDTARNELDKGWIRVYCELRKY